MYSRYSKRVFDFSISLITLIFLFPLLCILMIAVRVFLGAPIFFKQKRPGLNEKPFIVYKFRTMIDVFDENGNLLSDEKRLTRFGKLLRSTSLDELPELLNVVKGEMSLVGPRPLLMEYLPYYTETERLRHQVRPGLTGWAQVNGRNTLSWQDKFAYDVWYVKNCSFRLDMRIIFLTFFKILKRDGISAQGQATMWRFDTEIQKKISDAKSGD